MSKERGGDDFEVGVDVVLFDDISNVQSRVAVSIARNHLELNPHSRPPGESSIMVKYPMRGGFVPSGAKRADGTPYPFAGTGFGICEVYSRHARELRMFQGEETYRYFEIYQLAFQSDNFQVRSGRRVLPQDLVPDWTILGGGMNNAISDGDDFLVAMSAAPRSATHSETAVGGGGVMRFRQTDQEWRPISFTPVTGNDRASEATLVRDSDGSLLLTARGNGEPDQHDVRVWRSQDNGQTWSKIIHVRGLISAAPVTVNLAADGTPYIAGNLYLVPLDPISARFRIPADKEGNPILGGWTRQKLYLWPLADDRLSLSSPLLARDPHQEFGEPPGGSLWRVDHPSGANVQLRDGKWHHVLGYRIHEDVEPHGVQPPLQTGAYFEELLSIGQAKPVWNF
jgi:hypothetical protein